MQRAHVFRVQGAKAHASTRSSTRMTTTSTTCMAGRKATSPSGSRSRSKQQQQGPGGQPAWKRFAKTDKAIGKRAEATLEMIWSRTEWLTEDHIQGMWEEHRVRKDVVVAWFAEKRRASRRAKKGQGGEGVRGDRRQDESYEAHDFNKNEDGDDEMIDFEL